MISSKVIYSVTTLAELRSFRLAAGRMGVSAASFTRHIKQAEDFVGLPLFDRRGPEVTLTATGKQFLLNLEGLVDALGAFESGVECLRSSSAEPLQIGCSPVAARTILGPYLADLTEQAPGLRIKIRVSSSQTVLEELQSGTVDLVLCEMRAAARRSNIEMRFLRQDELTFWARQGHPLFSKDQPRLIDALAYPLISCSLPPHLGDALERWMDGGNAASIPHVECDDIALAGDLAARTDMVFCGCLDDSAPFHLTKSLTQLHLDKQLSLDTCIVRRKTSAPVPILDLVWSQIIGKKGGSDPYQAYSNFESIS